jgi:FKBP-type peptidyl-prolyl cis-trans isomerase FklB
MKQLSIFAAIVILSISQSFAQVKKATPAKVTKPAAVGSAIPKMASEMDSVAYSIGVSIAKNLQSQGLSDLNISLLTRGLQDAIKKLPMACSDEQIGMVLNKFGMKMQQKQLAENNKRQAEDAKKYESNKLTGEVFLAENKKKATVVTLPSGLQYEVIKAAEGPKPLATNTVKVHYHGTLIDGTIFDSSVNRGTPAEFGVTQVIQGWIEGLQLMPLGSKWKFFIPYNLAYGERSAGAEIKPYSTLVFEVELLEIK